MRKVLRPVGTVCAVVIIALLFSYAWSKSYPPMQATPEEIKTQADLLRTIATPGFAFIGPLLGGVVSIGYVRRKRGLTPNQLTRLRSLYAEALGLLFLSFCF